MTGPGTRLPAVAAVALAAAVVVLLAIAGAVLWADFEPGERRIVLQVLTPPRVGLLIVLALVLGGVAGFAVHRLLAPAHAAARRLAEAIRLIAHGNPGHRVEPAGPAALRAAADAANELAAERSQLLANVEALAAGAKARVEDERKRLAALISELDQSVLVCNRDGRILLYNAATEALIGAGGPGAAKESLGLGRPVSGILDRNVILHAVEAMEHQLSRNERESVHFVTATRDGRLLRLQAAPVTDTGGDGSARALAGYVLLLSDVTQRIELDAKRAALFEGFAQATRAALANIRAAIENVTEHPDMDAARRARFSAIIREEAVGMSDRLRQLGGEMTQQLTVGWPLEEMRGEDLLTLARSRIERRTGLPTKLESVDPALWLRVDSLSLAQGLSFLAARLKDEFHVREVRFALAESSGRAQLDVLWLGPPMSSETSFALQSDPFTLGGEESPLTLAQLIERHGGAVWYQRDVPTQKAYFRFLLPLAPQRAAVRPQAAAASRPEFYDFDLFALAQRSDALDDRPLAGLAYTVFDTETTGLNPNEGDEIIAIGAVRIVNGRLLRGETFETLVDPQRSLPESAVAVHGITAEAVKGQPLLAEVLPRLHRFSEDTVLVGHNAAFDMRFLQLKEAQTGVRFEQPVLDTLLLSAIVHPGQDSHGLEEIAARLGVQVVGRHTALGDALLTGELFLRLLPLLAQRGIGTLGEARRASQQTYYARIRY
jgi:DNA polymerase-3 subunit epsilon